MSGRADRRGRKRPDRTLPIYREHSFALGFITATAIAAVVFFAFDDNGLTSFRAYATDTIPVVGTLLVAIVSLFLSLSALKEQRKARQAGTDPVILVHLGHRPDAPMLATLEVSNVGAGAALNVRVRLDGAIVAQMLEENRIVTDFRNTTHPIRAIPQNHSVSYNFGLGRSLLKEPPPPPIRVDIDYEDIDGVEYGNIQWLDVREIRGQRAETPVAVRISDSLDKIARKADLLGSSSKPIHTVNQTKAEYKADKQAEYAELAAHLDTPPDNEREKD